jgi:hypothetical protein
MTFIQPCFIRKNTPELRKKLEELGYEPCHRMTIYPNAYKNIAVCNFFGSRYYGVSDDEAARPGDITDAIKNRGMIDCGTNEDLFFALAALRDDSDINQYFFCDKVSFTLGKTYYPDDYLYYQYDEFFDKQNWHKATVEEIIEHFKKK